jgi:hypothetical protein
MPTDAEIILERASKHFPSNASLQIKRTFDDYFGGELYQLRVEDDGQVHTCFALKDKDVQFFGSIDDFILWTKSRRYQTFRNIDPLLLVPSFIAVMITSIIGWYAIEGKGEAPAYLASAMATILGFYFGRSTVRS